MNAKPGFDPLHYLTLLEQKKTLALDRTAPLAGWQFPQRREEKVNPATESTYLLEKH